MVGETAVVGDDVSMLHRVTLGGSGVKSADRHPKVKGILVPHRVALFRACGVVFDALLQFVINILVQM